MPQEASGGLRRHQEALGRRQEASGGPKRPQEGSGMVCVVFCIGLELVSHCFLDRFVLFSVLLGNGLCCFL